MIKTLEGILLSSQNAKMLAKFYRETLGLKQTMEAVFGEHDGNYFQLVQTRA